jgi:hypothetical protein
LISATGLSTANYAGGLHSSGRYRTQRSAMNLAIEASSRASNSRRPLAPPRTAQIALSMALLGLVYAIPSGYAPTL